MNNRIKYITRIGILSGMSVILMLIDFPLFFAPSFYKLDISEVPILISSFAMGPASGMIMEVIKVTCNILINGTDTACVGEISNALIGISFVLPAALIYKYKKSKNGAIIGLGIGIISLCIVGSLLNAFVLLPIFSNVYGLPMDKIIAMGTSINSSITSLPTFIAFAVLPFNFIKGLVSAGIVVILYKRVSFLLKNKTDENEEND